MKTRVIPVRFPGTKEDIRFEVLLKSVQTIFADEAEFLPAVNIGCALPDADAVVFLSLPPEYAFHRVELIREIKLPIIVISSEYGARPIMRVCCKFLFAAHLFYRKLRTDL